jgi:hypothetical protein
MPAASVMLFNQFKVDLGQKLHDLDSDVWKAALVTSAAALAATTADPRWGAGGGTNLSSLEVPTGSAYAAGGLTLGTLLFSLVSNVPTWSAVFPVIAQDTPTGFTTARYVVIYNGSDAGKRCAAYIDMLSDRRNDTGSFPISTTGNVLFTTN